MGGWGGGFGTVFRMVYRVCGWCLIGTRRGWFGLDWAWYIIGGGIFEYFHTHGMRIFVVGDGFRCVGP